MNWHQTSAATLGVALLLIGCQSDDSVNTRLAPSRAAAMVACILASEKPAATPERMIASCENQVAKIEFIGLDQLTVDGILAGLPGSDDPGISASCNSSDPNRAMSGVETMGYGIVMNGRKASVSVVQPDRVTSFQRDGSTESAPIAATSAKAVAPGSKADIATASSQTGLSPCAVAIVQALTVVSLCDARQWSDRGCIALRARMAHCGDPTRLMIDPDVGYSCQPTVDASAVKSALENACESRGRGGAPCKPEVSVNGWVGDAGGICASADATMSADKETCFVPVVIKGPRGTPGITAVIFWGRTTSGGPIFTAEPSRSPDG